MSVCELCPTKEKDNSPKFSSSFNKKKEKRIRTGKCWLCRQFHCCCHDKEQLMEIEDIVRYSSN